MWTSPLLHLISQTLIVNINVLYSFLFNLAVLHRGHIFEIIKPAHTQQCDSDKIYSTKLIHYITAGKMYVAIILLQSEYYSNDSCLLNEKSPDHIY